MLVSAKDDKVLIQAIWWGLAGSSATRRTGDEPNVKKTVAVAAGNGCKRLKGRHAAELGAYFVAGKLCLVLKLWFCRVASMRCSEAQKVRLAGQ